MASYVFYSVVFSTFIISTVLYFTRYHWLPFIPTSRFPSIPYLYHRLPTTFSGDIEAGFSSSAFDLSTNIDSGDTRAGLDERGKREIQKIMKARKVGFDEGRRLYMEQRFRDNDIGADGRPRDPKFVSFS
ncbi:hypothetical protein M501DRAFT_928924 [Patellaria atrata CBS 101060]|uniref:Uncharacterized protein n=1 Tax=Patellaria atrata CBS 101060 TaxID=1346257 RepID=A0A9P4SEM7_9PEZI|nr:hypothetical protein M501DRAFT_928924 [Patellaria atrata CBS 101060]